MSKIKLTPLLLPESKKKRKHNRSSESFSNSTQSPELIENIKNIAINFISPSISYEVCGTFNLDSDNNIIGYSYNPIFNKEESSRNYCNYGNLILSSKIWHTHPDKYYPSIEDIFKPIKNNKIKESYIISRYGFFKIFFDNNINNLIFFDINKINKILNEFYFNTNRGREYNEEVINILCKKLNNNINYLIKNKYLIKSKFKISFYLYN